MISKDWSPVTPLKELINQFRLRHFIFRDGLIPSFKPFPPRPEQCLTFYVRGRETVEYLLSGKTEVKPRSVISGQFTSRVNRYVSIPEFLMITVDFKPGGLYRLTGIPFEKFTNCDTDAEAVLGRGIWYLNEQLALTDHYEQMIKLIESFCIKLLNKHIHPFIALDDVLQNLPSHIPHNVDELSKHSFLSCRQLERKFKERIGINPQTFLRISRFNNSYQLKIKNPGISWFEVAIHSGFSDYQHLVKSYKEFANASPNQFMAEEGLAPGRILGLTSPFLP